MTKERNAFKAGLFILASLGLIVAIMLSIEGLEAFTQPTQARQVVFDLADNIGGLRVGDEVRVGGFKVGEVRRIQVAQVPVEGREKPRIDVTFAIPRKFVIQQGAIVVIETTVTGVSVLNFKSLGQGDRLPPETPLVGAGPATICDGMGRKGD